MKVSVACHRERAKTASARRKPAAEVLVVAAAASSAAAVVTSAPLAAATAAAATPSDPCGGLGLTALQTVQVCAAWWLFGRRLRGWTDGRGQRGVRGDGTG